jgi:hypothetical protein
LSTLLDSLHKESLNENIGEKHETSYWHSLFYYYPQLHNDSYIHNQLTTLCTDSRSGLCRKVIQRFVTPVIFVQEITNRKKAEEEREKLIMELQNALGKVKLLSGFLPICAACKKIRDDKGY